MENEAYRIEQTFQAPMSLVWKAITDKDEMKLWYFDLPEFKPEVGSEFRFMGGPTEDRQYKHICWERLFQSKKLHIRGNMMVIREARWLNLSFLMKANKPACN